jgi:hypothetical protein
MCAAAADGEAAASAAAAEKARLRARGMGGGEGKRIVREFGAKKFRSPPRFPLRATPSRQPTDLTNSGRAFGGRPPTAARARASRSPEDPPAGFLSASTHFLEEEEHSPSCRSRAHGAFRDASRARTALLLSGRASPARHGAVVETPSHRPPTQPSINRSPIPTSPGRPGCTDGKPREGGFWYDESNVWITATTHAEMNKGRNLKDYSRVLCRTCA